MDRRALFFLGAAVLCLLLVPVADDTHRWVATATGITYVVLAALSALDHWSRTNSHTRLDPPDAGGLDPAALGPDPDQT